MSLIWRLIYWLTDDYERIRWLGCKILGRHIEQIAMEHASLVTGGYLWRGTGRLECSVCHKDMGLVDADFTAKFPSIFEWH